MIPFLYNKMSEKHIKFLTLIARHIIEDIEDIEV